ncbi:MAG TPA: carboxypeptidase-like regulatory domain-containing protein [Candidatus Angelobacter sp.]
MYIAPNRVVLTAVLLVVCAISGWGQKAKLQGKVVDGNGWTPIPSVEVTIYSDQNIKVGSTFSDNKGAYSVSNLKQGTKVNVAYSKGGYKPHPSTIPVYLALSENPKDVMLYRETQDTVYWSGVADTVKQAVQRTQDASKYAELYERSWLNLSYAGLSPEAQVVAAQQLLRAAPHASASHRLTTFASVDMGNLNRTQANIRAAMNGEEKLLPSTIPPDVAVAIVVYEYQEQPANANKKKFSEDFENVWGQQANQQVIYLMNTNKTNFQDAADHTNKLPSSSVVGPG